jgi:hypothetical protein
MRRGPDDWNGNGHAGRIERAMVNSLGHDVC